MKAGTTESRESIYRARAAPSDTRTNQGEKAPSGQFLGVHPDRLYDPGKWSQDTFGSARRLFVHATDAIKGEA